MSNQVNDLFGEPHKKWLASLRRATKVRARRALLAKAILGTTRLIRLKNREVKLLKELRELLRAESDALLGYGPDAKLAKHILKISKEGP